MDKRIIWIWDQFRWCVLSDMCDTWFIIHSFLESCEWIDISQMVCSLWWWENVGQHKNSVWRLSCWYHKWCFKHQVVLECGEEQDKASVVKHSIRGSLQESNNDSLFWSIRETWIWIPKWEWWTLIVFGNIDLLRIVIDISCWHLLLRIEIVDR